MHSPQKENGYTPIANEIMEALARYRIPGEQMQCLLFIIRKTYRFNKKVDMISNSQFVKATGLGKGNVTRAVKILVEKRVVIKSDNYRIPTYRFNKDYRLWRLLSKKQPVIKKDKRLLSKVRDTKDSITKDKDLLSVFNENQDEFITTKKGRELNGQRLSSFLQFWNAFGYKQGRAAAADAWLDIKHLTVNIVKEIITKAKVEALNRPALLARNSTPIMAQGWLTARRWEDEVYTEPEPKKLMRDGTEVPDTPL